MTTRTGCWSIVIVCRRARRASAYYSNQSVCLKGGFLNYATYATHATQRVYLHGKGRPAMYKKRHSKLLFCLFFCEKKRRRRKQKGIHFGQEILFHTRDERGEFSLLNVRTRPQIISPQLPVLLSLIASFSEVGLATATIRSVHELSLPGETTPCDWSNLALLA